MLKRKSAQSLIGSFFLLFLAMSLAAHTPVQAITSGTVSYYYPDLSSLWDGPYAFTAPQTVVFFGNLQNDISPTGIDISFLYDSFFLTGSFNGEVFNLPAETITSLSVDQNLGATVTFDAHNIYINCQGLSFYPGVNYVNIDVNTTAPAPGTLLLFGSGLAGLIGLRRKYLG